MRPRCTELGLRAARLARGWRAALAAAALCCVGPAAAQQPLTLAFLPQENPEKLVGDIGEIAAYLTGALAREVRGRVTLDHAAAIEALAAAEADIAFMGALPAALARSRIGAEILLSEVYRGKPSYAGAIFVRRGGGVGGIEDLRGRSIAFADPLSESGYLYPLDILARAGLLERGADPQRFFARVYFAGGYQQAIRAVADGLVDAAGVSVYAPLLLPPGRRADVAPIALSRPIPSHAVIARRGLDPGLRAAFVAAMLALNRPERRHLLRHVYNPDGYVRSRQADYDAVAETARRHGVIR